MDATSSLPSTAVLQLGELVGVGGFGRVHRATHRLSGNPLAVKILNSTVDNEDEIKQEVRLLQSCTSAHVVQYHSCRASSWSAPKESRPGIDSALPARVYRGLPG